MNIRRKEINFLKTGKRIQESQNPIVRLKEMT
jgi:hypothetical protein